MNSYDKLKAVMEGIQKQMVQPKMSERAKGLKKVKCLYKEFGFTSGMPKSSLDEGHYKL